MSAYIIPASGKKKNRALGPCTLGCIVALLICFGTYSKIVMIPALVIAAVGLLSMQKERGLSLLLFLLPFSPVFKMDSAGMSFFTILIVIYCAAMFFRSGRFTKSIFAPLLFVVYLIMNGSYANISRCLDIVLGLLLIQAVFSGKSIKNSLMDLLFMFSIGSILSCVVALLSEYVRIFPGIIQEVSYAEYGGNEFERFRSLYSNSNYFTLDITVVISCYLMLYAQNKSLSKLSWICVLLLVLFGVMSASLSFFLSLALIVLATGIYMLRSNRRKLVRMLSVITVIGIIVYFVLRQGNHSALWTRINELLYTDTTVSEATTGRGELWETYWRYITSHLNTFLFGDGLNAPYIGSRGRGSHNTYLDMIYFLGIFGTGLFLASVVIPWKEALKKERRPLCVYYPLCALMIRAFAISILNINNFYFCIILVLLAIASSSNSATIQKDVKEDNGKWMR